MNAVEIEGSVSAMAQQPFDAEQSDLTQLRHVRSTVEIKDRFAHPAVPREWFLVPLYAIKEAVEKIQDGTITQYRYSHSS